MSDIQPLTRLIYGSIKDRYVDGGGLKKILHTAQTNNAKANITGVLLFNSGYFLQAIEGSRAQINQLYHVISADQRHQGVQLISMNDIDHRNWSEWSMQPVSISENEELVYQKYSGQTKFNPFLLSSKDAILFLEEITGLAQRANQ